MATKAPANTTIKKKEATTSTVKKDEKAVKKPAAKKVEAKPAAKTTTTKTAASKAPANKTVAKKTDTKPVESKPAKKAPLVDTSKMIVSNKPKSTTASKKTVYHVSKRDRNGREWKVFIQESDKVIKLFDTQEEALKYAKSLCKNKDDGSYVVLHGLDGAIRKY